MSLHTHAEHGNREFREEQYAATVRGAAKGAGVGFAAAAPTAYLLHRSWAPFRSLRLPVKFFFVMAASMATGAIVADKSGLAYERERYSDTGAKMMKRYSSREARQWDELSASDKALTWAKDNKFGVVAGSWVVSMGGIFAYIQTQPLSFAQKLVQARVWAQGITLASLVAMAGITQIPSAGDKILQEKQDADKHSWMEYMPKEEDENKQKQQGRDSMVEVREAKKPTSSSSSGGSKQKESSS